MSCGKVSLKRLDMTPPYAECCEANTMESCGGALGCLCRQGHHLCALECGSQTLHQCMACSRGRRYSGARRTARSPRPMPMSAMP